MPPIRTIAFNPTPLSQSHADDSRYVFNAALHNQQRFVGQQQNGMTNVPQERLVQGLPRGLEHLFNQENTSNVQMRPEAFPQQEMFFGRQEPDSITAPAFPNGIVPVITLSEQRMSIMYRAGGEAAVEAVISNLSALVQMGFRSSEIETIAAHANGAQAVRAVIGNHAELNFAGFSNAHIAMMATGPDTARTFRFVLDRLPELLVGFDDHDGIALRIGHEYNPTHLTNLMYATPPWG